MNSTCLKGTRYQDTSSKTEYYCSKRQNKNQNCGKIMLNDNFVISVDHCLAQQSSKKLPLATDGLEI